MPDNHPEQERNAADPHRYDDILYLPHPTSATHPRMDRAARAAQFAPFAALTGFEEVIEEVTQALNDDEPGQVKITGHAASIRAGSISYRQPVQDDHRHHEYAEDKEEFS